MLIYTTHPYWRTIMGSIRLTPKMKIQRHWMDKVRQFVAKRPQKLKQKKSLQGQGSLFDDYDPKHLKGK